MNQDSTNLEEVGLEVVDAQSRGPLLDRRSHSSVALQLESMERIARAFVEKPDTILQELVNAGVVLCERTAQASASKKKIEPTRSFITGLLQQDSIQRSSTLFFPVPERMWCLP